MSDVAWITVIATVGIAIFTPIDWYVARKFYKAWKGGETIPYFAPILWLIVSVSVTVSACLLVGLSAVKLRIDGEGFIPPGVGLAIIAAALLLPSSALVWLWYAMRRKRVDA